MGEYIGVILEEVKDRPIYSVKEERNLDTEQKDKEE